MRALADAFRASLAPRQLATAFLLAALVPGAGNAVAEQQRNATHAAVAQSACPSLADGQGRRVQGRGDPDSVGTSFEKRCSAAPRAAQSRAVPAPAPALRVDSAWQREREAAADPGLTVGRMSATVLTSGVVVWVLQSSFLASLLVLGVPLWRHVDLLPIVERATDGAIPPAPDVADVLEERALARVLGAGGVRASDADAPAR